MKHSLLLLLLCIPFLSAFPQQIDGELYNLTKMKNGYRSKRISSYDKNGYNGDRIVGIKPNEKVVICDIQGAGIINQKKYLQPIITQYFIDNKSEIWLLFLIAHSKR